MKTVVGVIICVVVLILVFIFFIVDSQLTLEFQVTSQIVFEVWNSEH